ncbi:MAG: response regulator [Deltaproteobacteria bacterium]|nr:response regulator [Deltaproteobacteria bacterium]
MKVLLVEDNEALAENFREVLEDHGHQVAWAPDRAAARELAPQGFDVAMVDVRLPDGPGTALLPILKSASPEAEVIVTSGNADVESAIAAVQAGAFSYLIKPVAPQELLVTFERLAERVHLRRRAAALQEELARSEQRYRAIVETAQVFVVAVDRELTVRFVNAAFESAVGYPRDALVGRSWPETFIALDEREERSAWIRSAFLSPTNERQVTLLRRDGTPCVIRIRWTAPKEGEGDVVYGVALDVTRQVQLERERRTQEKLAAVGTLTAGLAHEIRNPLNAALLQLTLAERRIHKLPGHEREPLLTPMDMIRAELGRLSRLLGDFLAFARPRDFARERVDLSNLVRGVVGMHMAVAAQSGRTLREDVTDGVSTQGDADALKGAVVNLVKNALEASRTDVVVTLRRPRDGQVELIIRDDGPGIPSELAARIFEPFFTTKEGGTGLGLAIVYATVTGHGGEVSLTPVQGGGTVAQVVLPVGP